MFARRSRLFLLYRFLTLVCALFLLLGSMSQVVAQDGTPEVTPVTATEFDPGNLNLPAMVLTPGDLDDLGLPGFGKFNPGGFARFQFFFPNMADFIGKPLDDVRALYEQAGWTRRYVSQMGSSVEPGNPDSELDRLALSDVVEYADATGAQAAFEYEAANIGETPWIIDVEDLAQPIGDAAHITRASLPIDQGGPIYEYFLTFRTGNLVASTGFVIYREVDAKVTPTAVDGSSPAGTRAELEAMANRLLERINAVLAENDPGLSPLALRVGPEDGPSGIPNEGYRRIEDDIRRFFGESDADLNGDPAASSDATAVYDVDYFIQVGDELDDTDPHYYLRLYQFADDATASAFFSSTSDVISDDQNTLASAVIEGSPSVGDESILYSVDRDPDILAYQGYVRVGSIVAEIVTESTAGRPAVTAAEALIAAQAACLETRNCSVITLPSSILTTEQATPTATS